MKSLCTLVFVLAMLPFVSGQAVITAVFDGPLGGGTPKGVEIYFTQDVADLTRVGLSSANNGSGPTGTPEFTLPGGSVTMGQYIYVASEDANFNLFFGFLPDFVDNAAGSVFINGDDAIELFFDGAVIDVFGDVNVDGTGQPWEHLDGWAARLPNTGPDGSTFTISSWQFSGVDALDGEMTNATAATPVPIKSYSGGMVTPDHVITARNFEFVPDVLVVDIGDIVQWDNVEGNHNINGALTTFPNNSEDFFSGNPAPAPFSYQYAFFNPGNNEYQCDPHAGVGMVGKVLVREDGDVYVDVQNNFFAPQDVTIDVGQTVVWTNVSGFHNVNGTTGAYPNNPEGFGNGSASLNWTYAHRFTLPGVYDYHCDPHLGLGMVGTITVNSPYKPMAIADVIQEDVDGNVILRDSLVQVAGVVHGPNYTSQGSGLEFFLIDATNTGLVVRTTLPTPDYTVTEGDALTVSGQVTQRFGAVQLTPEIITINSTGNALNVPEEVLVPTAATEGSFIAIKNLTVVDTSAWPDDNSSANVLAARGTDTILIRIDRDISFDIPAPLGPFDILGLGGQFDTQAPLTEGYQIYPRSGADIMEVSGTTTFEDVGITSVFPNPVTDLLHVLSETDLISIAIIDLNGKTLLRTPWPAAQSAIDIGKISSGMYIVEIQTEQGTGFQRIIKK